MSVTTQESAETKAMRRSAKSLSPYLNDHLAGETLGVELAKRATSENNGTPLGTFLLLLSWELEEDRESLVRLMGKLISRAEGQAEALERRRVAMAADALSHRGGSAAARGSTKLAAAS